MPRCPLCNTNYPAEAEVCAIDGTALGTHSTRTASVAISIPPSPQAARPSSAPAAGKGRPSAMGLASMEDEVTQAAKPQALARARQSDIELPPRIATGSGTAAPKSSRSKDKWSTPFIDYADAEGIGAKTEEWAGRTLGSYRLISILGKGGMGCVYRAEHIKLGRDVALKVLRSEYAKRKDAIGRFFQEARAVNKIRHRNIVDITDLVELDDGNVFIIMEFIPGSSLSAYMKARRQRVDGSDTIAFLNILVQICDGLAAAHSVGIVHRDLKPDNIIVSSDEGRDLVKLLDFGVAKLLDKDEDDDIGLQTVAGSVVGTPAYMSPEQAGGMQVDGRADIYSLGAIMYEMFTKQPMFRGKSFGEFVRLHLNESPTLPRQTAKGGYIDPRIEEIILRCIEKNTDKRFQSAKELRAELLSLLASLETTGELTSALRKLKAAAPTGAARPSTIPDPPMHPAAQPGSSSNHGFASNPGALQQSSVGQSSVGQSSVRQSSVGHASAGHSSIGHASLQSSPAHAIDQSAPGLAALSGQAGELGNAPNNPYAKPASPQSPFPSPYPPRPNIGQGLYPPTDASGYPTHPESEQTLQDHSVPQTLDRQLPPSASLAMGAGLGAYGDASPGHSSGIELKKKNSGLKALLLLLVLGLIGGGGVFIASMLKGGDKGDDKGKEAQLTPANSAQEKLVTAPKEDSLTTAKDQTKTENSSLASSAEATPYTRSIPVTANTPAEVFAEGGSVALCTTPCSLEFSGREQAKGGLKTYFIRAQGYSEKQVSVELSAIPEKLSIELIALPEESVGSGDEAPTKKPSNQETQNKNSSDKNSSKKSKGDSKAGKGRKKGKPCKKGAQDTFNPFGGEKPC